MKSTTFGTEGGGGSAMLGIHRTEGIRHGDQ